MNFVWVLFECHIICLGSMFVHRCNTCYKVGGFGCRSSFFHVCFFCFWFSAFFFFAFMGLVGCQGLVTVWFFWEGADQGMHVNR